MFQIWIRAITRPVVATYQELLEETPNPSLGTALLWTLVSGALAAVLAGVVTLIAGNGRGFNITAQLTALLLPRPVLALWEGLSPAWAFTLHQHALGLGHDLPLIVPLT